MGGWAQPTGAPHIAAKAIDPITVRETLLPQRAIRSIIGVLFLKRGIYPSDTTVDQQSRRDNIGSHGITDIRILSNVATPSAGYSVEPSLPEALCCCLQLGRKDTAISAELCNVDFSMGQLAGVTHIPTLQILCCDLGMKLKS